jgi:hypothetical protein
MGMLDIFTHDFPYTDNHELNLSWVIKKVQELNINLDTLEERVKLASIEASKEYVDSRLEEVLTQFNELSQEVDQLRDYFDNQVENLQNNYNAFVNSVQQQIVLLTNRINDFDQTIKNDIIGVNALTDLKIQQNNDYILEQVAEGLVNVKVVNYFTGALITVQEMFNYLAQFHLEDAISYSELASANITYNDYVALHMTYTELAQKGKSFIL